MKKHVTKQDSRKKKAQSAPPEWFAYQWEHVRRNDIYQREYRKYRASESEYEKKMQSTNPTAFAAWEEDNWQINTAARHDAMVLRNSLQAVGIPTLIDPETATEDAWEAAYSANLSVDPQAMIFSDLASSDPRHPSFAPVQFVTCPNTADDALFDEYIGKFYWLFKEYSRSQPPDSQTESRSALRSFLHDYPYLELRVNTALPVTTLRRQFARAISQIVKLRKDLGLKQFVQRHKRNWRNQILLWDKIQKIIHKHGAELTFTNKVLKQLYPTEVNILNNDHGMGRLTPKGYKKRMDRLRAKTEVSYTAARLRINESFHLIDFRMLKE